MRRLAPACPPSCSARASLCTCTSEQCQGCAGASAPGVVTVHTLRHCAARVCVVLAGQQMRAAILCEGGGERGAHWGTVFCVPTQRCHGLQVPPSNDPMTRRRQVNGTCNSAAMPPLCGVPATPGEAGGRMLDRNRIWPQVPRFAGWKRSTPQCISEAMSSELVSVRSC